VYVKPHFFHVYFRDVLAISSFQIYSLMGCLSGLSALILPFVAICPRALRLHCYHFYLTIPIELEADLDESFGHSDGPDFDDLDSDDILSDNDDSDWEDLLPHGLSFQALDALGKEFAASTVDENYEDVASEDEDTQNDLHEPSSLIHQDTTITKTVSANVQSFEEGILSIIADLKRIGNPHTDYKKHLALPSSLQPIASSAFIFMMNFSTESLTKRFLEGIPLETKEECGRPDMSSERLPRIDHNDEHLGIYLNTPKTIPPAKAKAALYTGSTAKVDSAPG